MDIGGEGERGNGGVGWVKRKGKRGRVWQRTRGKRREKEKELRRGEY